jgi:hypothetical protein
VTEILDKALDAYRRQLFFEQLNAGYAALRNDVEAWAEELHERKEWDATLMDGLEPNERWTNDGQCLTPESEGSEDGVPEPRRNLVGRSGDRTRARTIRTTAGSGDKR